MTERYIAYRDGNFTSVEEDAPKKGSTLASEANDTVGSDASLVVGTLDSDAVSAIPNTIEDSPHPNQDALATDEDALGLPDELAGMSADLSLPAATEISEPEDLYETELAPTPPATTPSVRSPEPNSVGDTNVAATVGSVDAVDAEKNVKADAKRSKGETKARQRKSAKAARSGKSEKNTASTTDVDAQRLFKALAMKTIPFSPQAFASKQRSNMLSALGIITALGVSGWYMTTQKDKAAGITVQENVGTSSSKSSGTKTVSVTAPVARPGNALIFRPLKKVKAETLLSLGDLEYRMSPRKFQRIIKVSRGDTFSAVLIRAGVPKQEAHRAITSLRSIYDPRKLRIGKRIAVNFGVIGSDTSRFLGVTFDSSYDKTVQIERQKRGDFVAAELKKALSLEYARSNGVIKSSLFGAGIKAGAPPTTMVRMIHMFSFTVDFQRDIRSGDKFQILYRVHRDQTGRVVRTGEIAYASLTVRGTAHRLYRWQVSKKSNVEYLNAKGEGNRKALMKTPIDGARLTSGFGPRRHPILGYSGMHTGIDFGAPTGTPIYAAGDGTIAKVGWYGGYGRYIRIRHNKKYATAYGHMSRFASGIKVGSRVKQGQTIGYVGSTGRSTGPHLHYEVLQHSKHINPLKLTLPSRKRLQAREMQRFLTLKRKLDTIYAALKRSGASGKLLTVKAEPEEGCANGIRLDPTNNKPCK
jgi:murein DD-endopeptidase MepM/ murein hydrolase activator NlpD